MSTFTYQGRTFYKDGEPYQILSGAIHYWRVVPAYWEDRLRKLKACGFNTVETYIPWNLHERHEGTFDFTGPLDLVRYIETAEKVGLNVIVRPGPYICAEHDLGGLPSWLLKYENMHLRCNDPQYLEKVYPYYREVLTRLRPHLCTNGGGIIMVQLENEYGSYGNDKEYLHKVADIHKEFGIDCLLYTSDGPCEWMLGGGSLPEYLCVANFGSSPKECFAALEEFRPNQPAMCGEFWCGWFDHWGEEHHTRDGADTARTMGEMLEAGASFNFYMFHGGTNFAFTNGANYGGVYQPTVTSYDYCAPVSECGDLTPTYYAVRETIEKYKGKLPPLDVENLPKKAYGKLELTERANLFEQLDVLGTTVHHAAPLPMEEVGQDFGYILYRSTVRGPWNDGTLQIEHMHDRGLVYIDGKLAGVRDRTGRCDPVHIHLGADESLQLDILVENGGRINYGTKLFDKKGIYGSIRFGQQMHFGWDMVSLPMDDLTGLTYTDDTADNGMPGFLRGYLSVDGTPADTFLRLDGFQKGFVMVNGFNIGRYWNEKGPQKTLYVPAPLLHEGKNEIIVFESDGYAAPVVEFCGEPDLG